MIVTSQLIEEGKSKNGGWSTRQLKLIGVEWPPVKDWKARVIGQEISDEDAQAFVKLKDAHAKSRKLKKAKCAYVRSKASESNGLSEGERRWAKSNRAGLLAKDNRAEERMHELLKTLPLNFERERPIGVNGRVYFMDFLVTSTKKRRKLRVCIEIDGKHHAHQQEYDRQREADLLSTCRVWSVLRMGWGTAMRITGPELMDLITGMERGTVRNLDTPVTNGHGRA